MTAEERAAEFLARGIPMGRWDTSFGDRLADAFRSAASSARTEALEEAYHIAARSAEAGTFPGATSAQRTAGREAAAIAIRIRALASKGDG